MSIRYDDKFVKVPQMELEYTPEMISDLVKCSQDILYFLNFVTIVTIDGGRKKLGDLLYPFQKDIIKMCKDHRYLSLLCARQTGKSTVVGAFALWYAIFQPDSFIGIASNKASSAKVLLRRIKIMYEELPFYLKPGVVEYNKTSIEFENGSKVETAGTTEDTYRGTSCVPDYTKVCICDDYGDIFYTTIEKTKAISSNINRYMEDEMVIKNIKKYYYVYKTTNILNNKIYIGFHSTNDLDDGYLGSGKLLRRSVEKYGPENFKKEIIEIFDNQKDAEALEREIVNREFVKESTNYNLSIGGNVCILFGESNGFYGKKHTEETKHIISKKARAYKHTPKAKKKISDSIKKLWSNPEYKEKMIEILKHKPPMSKESRQKLSKALKGRKFSEEHRRNISIGRLFWFSMLSKEGYDLWYDKTFTKERNAKLSRSLKGHKKSNEWVDKINRNPEKIRKTAEKHRGMKRNETTRKRISDSKIGKEAQNRGKIHIYNPLTSESKQIHKDEMIPEGWLKSTGKRKESRKDTIWIHNIKSGKIKAIKKYENLPDGWDIGRK